MATTTTQQIDTTAADADAYLRKNNPNQKELTNAIDLVDNALKTASPEQKKLLEQELKVRQKALNKFNTLVSSAIYHGYLQDASTLGLPAIDSARFAHLADYIKSQGGKVEGYTGKGGWASDVSNFLTGGKPVNKKAVGLGLGLGAATAVAGIMGKFAGKDLTAWLVTTAVPEVAKFLFTSVLSPMFAISPTFAIGALALGALGVPKLFNFIKGKVIQLMNDSKVKKATNEVTEKQNAFNDLLANVDSLTDEQIQNMSFLTADQIKQLQDQKAANQKAANDQAAQDAKNAQAKKDSAEESFINSDTKISDTKNLTDAGLEADEVTRIQAKAVVARTAPGKNPLIVAYNRRQALAGLSPYAKFLDETEKDSSGKPISLADKKQFGTGTNAMSLNELCAAIETAKNETAKANARQALITAIQGLPESERASYVQYANSYAQIQTAKNNITKGKTIAESLAEAETALQTAVQGTSLEEYDPGATAGSGAEEQNKRVLKILEEAAKIDSNQNQKTNLQKAYQDHLMQQMGS